MISYHRYTSYEYLILVGGSYTTHDYYVPGTETPIGLFLSDYFTANISRNYGSTQCNIINLLVGILVRL